MGPQPVNMDELNVKGGIYGAECALGMQGFCSFDYRCFPIFLCDVDARVNLMPIAIHPMITKPTEDELIHLRGDFYMTTPERSIIDMLRVYPESEFVSQALLWMDDYTKLRSMADKYHVRDILEREIEYAHSDEFEV